MFVSPYIVVCLWAVPLPVACSREDVSAVESELPTKRCDIHLWYLDMLTEGVFSGHMTARQWSIKTKIEHVMATEGGQVEVDCRMLRTYERLFRIGTDDEDASTSPTDAKREEIFSKNSFTESDMADVQLDNEHVTVDAPVDISESKPVFNNKNNDEQKVVIVGSSASIDVGQPEEEADVETFSHETVDACETQTDIEDATELSCQGGSSVDKSETTGESSSTETTLEKDMPETTGEGSSTETTLEKDMSETTGGSSSTETTLEKDMSETTGESSSTETALEKDISETTGESSSTETTLEKDMSETTEEDSSTKTATLDTIEHRLSMDPLEKEAEKVTDASHARSIRSHDTLPDRETGSTPSKDNPATSQGTGGHQAIDEEKASQDSGRTYVAKIDDLSAAATLKLLASNKKSIVELVIEDEHFESGASTSCTSDSENTPVVNGGELARHPTTDRDDSSKFINADPTDSALEGDVDDDDDFGMEGHQQVLGYTIEPPEDETVTDSLAHLIRGVARYANAYWQPKYDTDCRMSYSFMLPCSMFCYYASLFRKIDEIKATELKVGANYQAKQMRQDDSVETSSSSTRDTPLGPTTATLRADRLQTNHGLPDRLDQEDYVVKIKPPPYLDSDKDLTRVSQSASSRGSVVDTLSSSCAHCHASLERLDGTSDARRQDYDRKFDMLELQLLRLENRLLLATVSKNADAAIVTKLENNLLSLENRVLEMSRDAATMRGAPSYGNSVLKGQLGMLGGRIIALMKTLEEQAARRRRLEERMSQLEAVNAALRETSPRGGADVSKAETDERLRFDSGMSDKMQLQPLDIVVQDSADAGKDAGHTTAGDSIALPEGDIMTKEGIGAVADENDIVAPKNHGDGNAMTRDSDDINHDGETRGDDDDLTEQNDSVTQDRGDMSNRNNDKTHGRDKVTHHISDPRPVETPEEPESSQGARDYEDIKEQRRHRPLEDDVHGPDNVHRPDDIHRPDNVHRPDNEPKIKNDDDTLLGQERRQHSEDNVVVGSVPIDDRNNVVVGSVPIDDRNNVVVGSVPIDDRWAKAVGENEKATGSGSVGLGHGSQTPLQAEPTEELRITSAKEENVKAVTNWDIVMSRKDVDNRGKANQQQLKQQQQQQQHQQQHQQQPDTTKNPSVIESQREHENKIDVKPVKERKAQQTLHRHKNDVNTRKSPQEKGASAGERTDEPLNSGVATQNLSKATPSPPKAPETKHMATNASKPAGKRKAKRKQFQIPQIPKYTKTGHAKPKDCYDHYLAGRLRDTSMTIRPLGGVEDVEVRCDMKNGGWTLIQRRQDGSVDFYRSWRDYKFGFGAIHGEHWLGNDVIHLLTNQDAYTLRVDMVAWDRRRVSVEYDYFMVDSESDGYRLHVLGHRGPGPDSLLKHSGRKFSTNDVDNDSAASEFGGSCAQRFSGAWWYFRCYKSNLNGRYYRGGAVAHGRYDGMAWNAWTGNNYSLKRVEMKIRPRRANDKGV